jgi:hypothetical protein
MQRSGTPTDTTSVTVLDATGGRPGCDRCTAGLLLAMELLGPLLLTTLGPSPLLVRLLPPLLLLLL